MSEQTALITGCSSGIGRATAQAFVEEDWTVYATSRNEADLSELAEMGCRTDSLDVTDEGAVEGVVDRIAEETGAVDCLVNNAGFGQFGPVEDVPVNRLHQQFDVNVYGPHRLVRASLPLMRGQREGTVVNVSSVYGSVSTPGAGTYAASKHALEAMTDALRAEVDELGIDVVLVAPGPVDTGFRARADRELDDLTYHREYDWVYDAVEDANLAGGALPIAVGPDRVATTIYDAACLSDPDPCYPVGRFAKVSRYTRFLPDRVRDGTYALVRKFL